ncbi:hypothetical protein GUITHDRAFT_140066 [Guillardia theta CCMP2712]|uniref:MOSC domain-containing protein n=1 Tax=Guillardia theta (strain CCMP2712) TaxID=905079 RepID=L1J745_GUITC|nr:hypothetical protein GUITHDRAFT_140066 [Guillardia theta CCMP2712]EKX43924.1 hypothetical protein GUITHDRAFT_140066 [Guillardia theta CCMP2712]|eukprot:XP_005830904.1 hypothetical protein GUITHDRAFT_140066 [Guillardia theta CCMP2712]
MWSHRKRGMIGTEEWVEVGEVTSLHIYPIKSCKGQAQESMQLDEYGAVNDRRYMIVDENGRFVTQRQEAALCQIAPAINLDGSLKVEAPGMTSCTVKTTKRTSADHAELEAGIWEDDVKVVDQGGEISSWLSSFVGRNLRLVGMSDKYERTSNRRFTPRRSFGKTAFSDGYPLLLISEESLHYLNSLLSVPLPMNRFRPNIVIKTDCGAFAEDSWRRIKIHDMEMDVVKPCSRCKITTTDQSMKSTGFRDEEPLITLSRFRK